ncbi:MAG: hypothetical protein KGL39_34765 [Patescibacteria group bacterium]|nr:hypothetical protein [Patescibacteria group bacterium]
MSTLHAERILAQLATATLTPAGLGVVTVARSYPYSLGDDALPAVVITQVADKPLHETPDTLTFQDWRLSVEFLVAVKSSALPLDTGMNAVRLSLHKALMADVTQTGLCIYTYPGEVTIEQSKDDTTSEQPISVMRALFDFIYRTGLSDPSI